MKRRGRKIRIFAALTLLTLFMMSCSSAAATEAPFATKVIEATSTPTETLGAVSTQPQANLPQTDAEVHRVSIDEAKAAFDRGEAIIVDVRGAEAYARQHITGALEVSLSAIQNNATVPLDKDKWIITYCT